jgi:hypothetical protein
MNGTRLHGQAELAMGDQMKRQGLEITEVTPQLGLQIQLDHHQAELVNFGCITTPSPRLQSMSDGSPQEQQLADQASILTPPQVDTIRLEQQLLSWISFVAQVKQLLEPSISMECPNAL